MNENIYDNWKLDTPDNHMKPTNLICCQCNDRIHIGEEIRITEYGTVHEACFYQYACDFLGSHSPVILDDDY